MIPCIKSLVVDWQFNEYYYKIMKIHYSDVRLATLAAVDPSLNSQKDGLVREQPIVCKIYAAAEGNGVSFVKEQKGSALLELNEAAITD
jgi:hypothetical protein